MKKAKLISGNEGIEFSIHNKKFIAYFDEYEQGTVIFGIDLFDNGNYVTYKSEKNDSLENAINVFKQVNN